MKFLVVIPTFYPSLNEGGPIISLYNQLFDLSKKIYLEVVTFQKLTKNDLSIQRSNLKINYQINNLYGFNILKYSISLRKFDTIFINSIFSFHCLKFILLSIIYKKNLIISPRGSISQSALKRKYFLKKTIIILIQLLLNKKKTTFLSTSKIEDKELKLFFSGFNFKILPNGHNNLDLHFEKREINEEILNFIDDKTILYFSRIDRKKNLHKLIKIIDGFKLLIVGDYSDNNYFNSLNLHKFKLIKYVGPIYNSKSIKQIFKKVGFLCLPSNFENFANCVLDSISNSCPVLITENIGLTEEIRKFNFGHIIKEEITNNDLIFMFNNLNFYKKRIDINKEEFIKKYSWSNINNELINTK